MRAVKSFHGTIKKWGQDLAANLVNFNAMFLRYFLSNYCPWYES